LFTLVPDQSEASYSVREQLARRDLPSDAVGKTKGISGQIVVNPDGSIDTTNSKFIVDVSTLQTDESMRDNFVRRNILNTLKYPSAVFVPKQVSGLPASLPQSGDVSFKVSGDLTIRNVTKPVTWDVTGSINNGLATGKATTSFTFEDFNLKQPQVPVVLSLVDKITLNVTVALQKAGG
jgi:polyisoprenoid-binding protein YceI